MGKKSDILGPNTVEFPGGNPFGVVLSEEEMKEYATSTSGKNRPRLVEAAKLMQRERVTAEHSGLHGLIMDTAHVKIFSPNYGESISAAVHGVKDNQAIAMRSNDAKDVLRMASQHEHTVNAILSPHRNDAKVTDLLPHFEHDPAPKDRVKKLLKAKQDWSVGVKAQIDFSMDAARKAFFAQHASAKAALGSGKHAEVKSREAIESEYEIRFRAGRELQKEAYESARPTLQAIGWDIVEQGCELALRIEDSERVECEKFGVNYKPSHLPLAIYAVSYFRGVSIATSIGGSSIEKLLAEIVTAEEWEAANK